jgi:hypothetical protein
LVRRGALAEQLGGVLVQARRGVVLGAGVAEPEGAAHHVQRTVGGLDGDHHVSRANEIAVERLVEVLDGTDWDPEGTQALLPFRGRRLVE